MSRLTELKKQYPELNVSIIDVFNKIDGTKSYKYLPLLCKLFSSRFSLDEQFKNFKKGELDNEINYIRNKVSKILNTSGLSNNEVYQLDIFLGFFNELDLQLFKTFKDLNERNLITNNDITSYKNFEEIGNSVSLAEIKMYEKEMSHQIVKEYEDDTWLIIRPLTFSSSSKYGAATKWCTTYKNDKQYFKRYWERGILIYSINKITGYKFATFKSLDGEQELSFWNATDQRIDFLEVDIEDYMYSVIKNILNSKKTNKDFCDDELIMSVEIECGYPTKSIDGSSIIRRSRMFEIEEHPISHNEVFEDDLLEEETMMEEQTQYEIRDEVGVIQLNPLR
jgi:hypothetical protein